MPLFRISITLANNQSFYEHRRVEDIDLDTYYQQMWEKAVIAFPRVVAVFEVVQVSEHSHVAGYMRERGINRLTPNTGKTKY